jgi:hypothetical protein
VETIGDAYMVVGGLPDRRKDHAEAIAMFALEMINEAAHVRRTVVCCAVLCCAVGLCCAVLCRDTPRYVLWSFFQIRSPIDNEPLKIRVGIHTYAILTLVSYLASSVAYPSQRSCGCWGGGPPAAAILFVWKHCQCGVTHGVYLSCKH